MGRNALYWPFTIGSIWNQPIGSSATYVNANLQPRTGSAFSLERIYMNFDPTQPAQPCYQNHGQSATGRGLATTPITNVLDGSTGGSLPGLEIPFNPALIIKAANANDPMCVVGTDGSSVGGTRYEMGNGYHGTAGTYTGTTPATSGNPTTGVLMAGHGKAYGTIIDDGLTGGSGGSNITTLGGTIRYGEFTNGTDGVTTGSVGSTTFPAIRHAFRFNLQGSPAPHTAGVGGDLASPTSAPSGAFKGWRWPATHADGNYNTPGQNNYYGGTVGDSVEGSLYAIPQTVNLAGLGLLTVPGKQLAWTLQNYGAYVCNNTVVSTWAWAVEVSYPATASGSTPAGGDVDAEFTALYGFGMEVSSAATTNWAKDVKILLGALYVVSNNTATNIGGGGTPLQPLAPAIGGSTGSGTIVQSGTTWEGTQAGATNTSLALPANTVAVGEYVVAHFSGRGASAPASVSLSDSLGNTYALVTGATRTQSTLHSEVWACSSITTGGSSTLTWSWTNAGCASSSANRWSNVSALDGTVVVNSGTGTAITSGTYGSTAGADLVIAAIAQSGAGTLSAQAFSPAGTAFNVPDATAASTGADNNQSQMSETLASASTTPSFSATSSVSSGWTAILMCFSPSGSTIKPSAPSGITATATGTSGQVAVGWTAPSVVGTGVTDYKVQYSTSLATLEANGGTVVDTSSTSTSYTVTGLTNGTLYYFGVGALNGSGAGPYSSAGSSGVYAQATPATTPDVPDSPAAVNIDSVGATDILFDWGPNPPNPGTQPITSYTLVVTVVGGGTFGTFTINDTNGPNGGPSLTYDVTGLTTGIPYTGSVTATNSVGTSTPATVSAIATPTAPPAPQTVLTTDYPPAAHPAISPRYAALLRGTGN